MALTKINRPEIAINLKDVSSVVKNIDGLEFLMYNPGSEKPVRFDSRKLQIGLEQTKFKNTITDINDSISALNESILGGFREVAQFEHIRKVDSDAVLLIPDRSSLVANIPLNSTHVNTLNTIDTTNIPISSIVDSCNDSADIVEFGLDSNYYMSLPPGTYEYEFTVSLKAITADTDTIIELFNNTPYGSNPDGVLLGTSAKKRLRSSYGTTDLTGRGYFFLCKSSDVVLRARATNNILLGDINSLGDTLGGEATRMSAQTGSTYDTTASIHLHRISTTDILKPRSNSTTIQSF